MRRPAPITHQVQTLLMPVAMTIGFVFHRYIGKADFLTPYLIFAMLFIPFCGVRWKEMKISGLHINLLLFQAAMSVLVYIVLQLFDPVLAQGAMICILAPTATAAVVIANMLGARVSTMLTYSLLVNVAVAVGAPLFFAIVAPAADASFGTSFFVIARHVIPVLVLPFVAALIIRRYLPKWAIRVKHYQPLSFYLWLSALTIVAAKVANFVFDQQGITWKRGITLSLTALAICLLQFGTGRYIGRRHHETVAGGQSLGQKNTILAIWLAQTYLNPVSSIAPASYVLWQTLVNSWQLWRRGRRKTQSAQ